jgi:seryl-tRNA synthetase
MIDPRRIRENPDEIKKLLARRKCLVSVDEVLSVDEERRKLQAERDALRHDLKQASDAIGKLKKEGKDATEAIAKTGELKARVKDMDERLSQIEARFDELLWQLPNLPDPDAPDEDTVLRSCGKKPEFDFEPKDHVALCENLELCDFRYAASYAGARFAAYTGNGALLLRALTNFCLDLHTKEHGYKEVFPPVLARAESADAAGQLSKLDDMYAMRDDPLYLIPTSETALVNMHMRQELKEEELPLKYAAYTSCFRREAGTYGTQTKGLFRIHQFEKVELVQFAHPDRWRAAFDEILSNAERVLQLLQLPYQVKALSPAEAAFQASLTFDIDVWAAGAEDWLEVSSISNCRDFQARRNKTRLRLKDGSLDYPYILNGSGTAFPRLIIAILENCQQPDGTVKIPEKLRPYMDGKEFVDR